MKKKSEKKSTKKTKTVKKNEPYHLLMYVDDCSPKIKRFENTKDMEKFVLEFQKENPDHLAVESGSWIDYAVFDVTGKVSFFTDGIKVE